VDTGHDNVANVTKKRRLDNLTPELLRRSTRKDSAQDLFIDTPCTIKKSCEYESPDIGLSPESLHDFFPSVPSPAYGPLPVFTTATECEQLENILPLTTFAVSEKVVEPQEYFSVIVNPETIIEDNSIKCNIKPSISDIQKSQVKYSSPTKPTKASIIATKNLIVCPNCDVPMTPKHECENMLVSTPPHTKLSDPPPPEPLPVELVNPPTTSEGFDELLKDPDFNRRMKAYTETNSECTIQ
jgi:hypothetical protein